MAETVLQAKRRIPDTLDDVPEVEYPEEVIERLDKEYEIFEAQVASGEIEMMTVKEFAAGYGIEIDNDE